MTRILSTDLLIADLIAPVDSQPALLELMETFHLAPGGKRSLEDGEAEAFRAAFKDMPCVVAPGGSSANVLTTLTGLLTKTVEVRFVGIAGEGAYGAMIREAMKQAHITLIPEHVPHGVKTQEAVSYVFVSPDGQCTLATHPGNARAVLKPALLPEHVVEHCDVVLAQGSLWRKFNTEFADRLYALTVKHGRSLWLTLPTQPHITPTERDKILEAIPHAQLILGNEGELVRMFGGTTPEALKKLQQVMRGGAVEGGWPPSMAFITLGERGAVMVSRDAVQQFLPAEIPGGVILTTIGAGDTCYAGFAAGFLRGLSPQDAAQIGLTLAAHKLAVGGPRLASPLEVLRKSAPALAAQLG